MGLTQDLILLQLEVEVFAPQTNEKSSLTVYSDLTVTSSFDSFADHPRANKCGEYKRRLAIRPLHAAAIRTGLPSCATDAERTCPLVPCSLTPPIGTSAFPHLCPCGTASHATIIPQHTLPQLLFRASNNEQLQASNPQMSKDLMICLNGSAFVFPRVLCMLIHDW